MPKARSTPPTLRRAHRRGKYDHSLVVHFIFGHPGLRARTCRSPSPRVVVGSHAPVWGRARRWPPSRRGARRQPPSCRRQEVSPGPVGRKQPATKPARAKRPAPESGEVERPVKWAPSDRPCKLLLVVSHHFFSLYLRSLIIPSLVLATIGIFNPDAKLRVPSNDARNI